MDFKKRAEGVSNILGIRVQKDIDYLEQTYEEIWNEAIEASAEVVVRNSGELFIEKTILKLKIKTD